MRRSVVCETKKWPKIDVKVIFFYFFYFQTFAEYAKNILWTFQIKIQHINVVILMSSGVLFKNTLKLLTLEVNFSILYFSKGEFQIDITSHRNVRF